MTEILAEVDPAQWADPAAAHPGERLEAEAERRDVREGVGTGGVGGLGHRRAVSVRPLGDLGLEDRGGDATPRQPLRRHRRPRRRRPNPATPCGCDDTKESGR